MIGNVLHIYEIVSHAKQFQCFALEFVSQVVKCDFH